MKKNKSLSPDAIKILKDSFESNEVFFKTDSTIVFLCGKKIEPGKNSARQLLLDYSNKHFPHYLFFLAEDFFDAYPLSPQKDLLSIEHFLTKYSDCIVIILESESAFAELGAFSIVDDIAKNLLIINDKNYKDDPSFINLGPIKKINRISNFGKVINTNLDTVVLSAFEIDQRLKKNSRKHRKRIKISDYSDFKKLDGKERLLLLLDIINIFEPINFSEIILLLKELFGEGNYDIQFDIGLLIALKLISSVGDYYVRNTKDLKYYFDFYKEKSHLIKSYNINHIHKYDRTKHRFLLKKIV